MVEEKNLDAEQFLELQKQNCIFCQIGEGKVPAKTVYSDEEAFAVLDINPAVKGHMLLMPKNHYAVMPQIPPHLISHLFRAAKVLSQAAFQSFKCKGTTVLVSNGASAGQKAPHFMIHVIPREVNDGLSLEMPMGQVSSKDASEIADKFRTILGTEVKKPEPVKNETELKSSGEKKKSPEPEKKPEPKKSSEREKPKKKGGKEFDLDAVSKLFEGGSNA